MKRVFRVLAVLGLAMLGLAVACAGAFGPCWSGWVRWGVLASECPVGVMPVVSLSFSDLGRGARGSVGATVEGQTFDEALRPRDRLAMSRVSLDVVLVDPDGKGVPLPALEGWSAAGAFHSTMVELPKELPDGDYRLRVHASTPAGDATAEAGLALYAPALEHTLVSAPLVKPGETVRFRAVLLDRHTLAPLAKRPGKWVVTDPTGLVVLEEKGRTDEWGVAASDLPLSSDSPTGGWRVEFKSGAATDPVAFEVREFTLPRMTVQVATDRTWFGPGDRPRLTGVVRYSSGAPVPGASLRVRLSAPGDWQPPPLWTVERSLVADASGAFEFDADAVPGDVVGIVPLAARVDATDAAGATATGTATVTLSADPIHVDAVTELDDGMVPSANNRLYVRATRPDGAPMPGADLRLRPAWDEHGTWIDATTDVDGVARYQLDPGAAVTVTEPAPPVRPIVSQRAPVTLQTLDDQLRPDPGLTDRAAVDRWVQALSSCAADTAGKDASVTVDVAWTASGTRVLGDVRASDADGNGVADCVRAALTRLAPTPGRDRLWHLELAFADSGAPSLDVAPMGATPGAFSTAPLVTATRPCVGVLAPKVVAANSAPLPVHWVWSTTAGSAAVSVRALAGESPDPAITAALRCIVGARVTLTADAPIEKSENGLLSASLRPGAATPEAPAPTTWPGFEFVAAVAGVGETHLRLHQGSLPALRLRFDEVVVDAGTTVGLSAIRGPSFSGTLPKKLDLVQGARVLSHFDFDPDKRAGRIDIPSDASGFASVTLDGSRAVLYVRPKAHLQIDLAASGATWKPGSRVHLTAHAHDGLAPIAAGLSLVGVDATMAQLAPLPPPDDFSRVTSLATMSAPAFGALDAKALQAGIVRGEAAQQATVLRIASLGDEAPLGDHVSGSGDSPLDVETPLTTAFFGVYAECRKAIHAWESSAPEGDFLTNDRMATFWNDGLKRHPAADPFGRSLRLGILPADLLAMTAPAVMADDGARLPEDVENWPAWVAKEKP